MSFHSYFTPTAKELLSTKTPSTLRDNIQTLTEEIDPSDYSLILIGLPDGLESTLRHPYRGADLLRQKLYNLSAFQLECRILDAGNLRISGLSMNRATGLLSEIVGDLISKKCFVLLFGGTHTYELGQFMAYEQLKKRITMLTVDNRINFSHKQPQGYGTQLDDIFSYHPNYLFHYIHLGYQSYLVSREALSMIEEMQFEAVRLGTIREGLRECEALIRQADMMSFDAAALNKRYAPAAVGAEIFGLSGEEACQMAWYGGSSARLSTASIYGYLPTEEDTDQTTAMTLATMLWYFIDGFLSRRHSSIFNEKEYVRYIVDMEGMNEQLVFYKSMFMEKWWMEIPFSKEIWTYNAIAPCSFSDYLIATRGEVPQRWLLMYNKMN